MRKRILCLLLAGVLLCSLGTAEVMAAEVGVPCVTSGTAEDSSQLKIEEGDSGEQESQIETEEEQQKNPVLPDMDSDSDRNDVDVSESDPEQNTVQSEEGNTEENWNPDSVQTEEIQEETEIEEAQVEQPEIEEAQTEETQEPAEEEEISQQGSTGTLTMKSVTKAAAASYTPISYTPKYTNPIQNTISGVSFSTVRDKTIQIIGINEGDYVTVVKDDNGALSIGKMQWHATRALNLLKTIASANNQQAYELLGEKLYEEIRTSSGWGTRIINDDEKNKIKALLATAESKAAQDKLAVSDVNVYINHGLILKISNPAALVYFADVENQWGAGGSRKCAEYAKNLVGKDCSKITLNEMHLGTVCYTYTRGGYYNRRQNTYNKAADLGWVYCHSGDLRITSVQWLQKSLNAYQNAGLTVDGSYGEATKAAVRKFQKSAGIGVDGSAGPQTYCTLIYKMYYAQASGTQTPNPSPVVPVEKKTAAITVSKSSYALNDNHSNFSLGAKSNHAEAALSYTSSDTSVATVNSSGTVDIKKAGSAVITIAQPATENYKSVSKTVKLTVYSTSPSGYTVPTTTLSSGRSMKKSDIQWLQAVLLKLGYSTEVIDGVWDTATTASVKKFQSAKGLDSDGSVGPATRAKLISFLSASLKKATITVSKTSYAVNDNHRNFAISAKSNHSQKPLTFKSSNTSVATVNSKGTVDVKKAGTAVITVRQAQSADYKAAAAKKVKITVYSTNPSSYKVPTTTLSQGRKMSKSNVQWLQACLVQLNCSTETVDGVWDKMTLASVKKFQKSAGLSVDGSVGPGTRGALQNFIGVKTGTMSCKAAAGTGKITVSWSKMSGASGYYVYRKTASGSYKKIKTIKSANTLKYTDTSAKKNTVYYYCVKAYRKSGSLTAASKYKSSAAVRRTK